MIGRFLCRIGLHGWQLQGTADDSIIYTTSGIYARERCTECGAERNRWL